MKSSAFGSLTLSGRDAEAFIKQVNHGRSNKAARAAVASGNEMLSAYKDRGYVRVKLTNKKAQVIR